MLDNGKYIFDLMMSGILVRFPTLDFVSVESGCGWVPFVLEGADYHFKKAKAELPSHPWGDLLPSDLFRRQVYVCTWFEHLSPELVEAIGEDNILIETDFPHRTCLEERDVEHTVNVNLGDLSDVAREKDLWRERGAPLRNRESGSGMTDGPLNGLRVVDCGHGLAGTRAWESLPTTAQT